MLFTPKYNVIYHGKLHESQKTFEIDEADAEEMRAHGIIKQQKDKPGKNRQTPKDNR